MVAKFAILALAGLAAALPNPNPQFSGYVEYVIDTQGDADNSFSDPLAYTTGIEVGPGGTVSFNDFHSESVSFTIGGDLGLDPGAILSLGLSGSTTETTTDGINEGASYECPDDASPDEFTCALKITPNFWQVNGHVNWHEGGSDSLIVSTAPYTAMFPKSDQNGIGFANVELCLCPNPDNMIYPAHGSVDVDCPQTCGA